MFFRLIASLSLTTFASLPPVIKQLHPAFTSPPQVFQRVSHQ